MVSRGLLPGPGQVSVQIREGLRILLMSSTINSLTHRVRDELQKYNVVCHAEQTDTVDKMMEAVKSTKPDIIVCPYLIHKIPRAVYEKHNKHCLIVHPGTAGDRGVNSLDFAIRDDVKTWGVTVLDAVEEYDAGNVWSTEEFQMPADSTKTALYTGVISDVAVKCVIDSVSRISQGVPSVSINKYGLQQQRIRHMTKKERTIDWEMSATEIARVVRMSDTRPGAVGTLRVKDTEKTFRLYDAHIDDGQTETANLLHSGNPGDIVARRNGSVLVKCADGQGIWIGQLKKDTRLPSLKLPAEKIIYNNGPTSTPHIFETCSCDDIQLKIQERVAYISFDFYNGAMSTEQGKRLLETINYVKSLDDVTVVALIGGERFFSTGINLSQIQDSRYKQLEAWANINSINDVISAIIHMKNKASVAVMRGNAGAGGVMFAAACDVVISHPGVLLTPSYDTMSLFGSEYWTYFLPRRVGHENVKRVMSQQVPFSAIKAQSIGLIDYILGRNKASFIQELPHFLHDLMYNGTTSDIIREKRIFRDSDWSHLLQTHRKYELENMSTNFRSEKFLNAMAEFVNK